jgi:hypothetical protein
MKIKGLIKNFSAPILGLIDFFRQPSRKHSWGGPFNGQRFRQRIFFDLLYHFPIKAIVETGTFHGTTTSLFAVTSLPVYTVEINPRQFYYSKMRFFFDRSNVNLYLNDSRSFLRYLSENNVVPKEDVFFYLDAHWGKNLPLLDELKIIFLKWKKPIVMIDDFQVPNSNYRFDTYGPDKTLNLAYIYPVVTAHKLSIFFPIVNSSEETGAKRGCVVLSQEQSGKEIDTKIKTLVQNTL